MPLPGGLWWLLCCRRGFTLLHRDYGDGELSGDGEEDEDEETFELRSPSPAGGGRVSPWGFRAWSQVPLTIKPSRGIPLQTSQMPRAWQTGDVGEVSVWEPKPLGLQGAAALLWMCLRASRRTLGAVHLLGALRQGRRHAWPDLALPLPSLPGSRPIPSPSASASAEECGEAGWAARTPGSPALPIRERWSQMRELLLRGPGRGGEGILGLGSAVGTPRRGSWGPWLFEDPSSLPCHSGQNSWSSLGPLDITLSQPGRSGPISDRLQSWEETWSLIPEKGLPEDDPDVVVKGWLYREPRGVGARPWLPPRRAWFVLTRDSLDQFSSSGKGARRLGSLVLTSLCSVTGPERRPKETGLWSVTVSGRKHSVRLCTPRQAEAERWGVALREVIASKAPLETPTQLLLRDIQESCGDPEAVALIYRRNPILRHTTGALYAPLLPLPYGVSAPGPGYAPLREEAVRLFLALQALEGVRRPWPLMQGVLQTCRDLPALQDELFLQLAKQTSGPAGPPGLLATQDPAALRYWQLLTCMSCTFRPGGAVRGHLLGHLERTEQALPDSELAEYARFIRKALGRTRGRDLVPSLAEISALSRRQELLCTVHCPGAGACPVAIDSHTTVGEVARELVGRLGLARSRNTFALYEQRGVQERALAGGTLVADVLTSLAVQEAGLEDSPDSGWRLCLRLHGPLHPEGLSPDGHELPFLFEQAHALLLRGRPPPPDDTLRALAALRLQSLHRDFSPRVPLPSLDRLLPPPAPPREDAPRPAPRPHPSAALLAGALWSPGLAKRRAESGRRGRTGRTAGSTAREGGGGAGTAAAVLGGWKRLRGMGRAEAMAAYLALAAQCPGFGAARYDVLELSTEPGGGTPQKLCLGLGAKAMSLSRPGETEPIHSVSYGHVAACQLMDPHTLALRVGESQLLLRSPQVEEIMQLVNAYLANPSPERPCSSPSPPCQDLPDISPPSQHPGLDETQGQSGCLGQLQD
ncbi:pleckstrin homology domain-containing family H member 3 isoform X2 [Nycticebus coucang]|uniref:pleckstrin homology domain-containing family H member 3 isoform X2 n=1 Tax=Nycticebus coucang TaxID=9470 RepID=UPI00234C73C9|nr:pleckstrin homology domain-containing family H member 3 isoform X2 [Nycticebus coucang]